MRRLSSLLLAGLLVGSGCAAQSYQIPTNELQRLSMAPPETRGARVLVSQEVGGSEVNSAETVGPDTEIILVPRIYIGGTYTRGERNGGGVGAGGGGGYSGGGGGVSGPNSGGGSSGGGKGGLGKLGSGGGDGKAAAVVIVVAAAVALFVIAGIEGSRFDGWVQMHPMHPMHSTPQRMSRPPAAC